MKFIAPLALLASVILPCLADPVKVVYDATYDNPDYSTMGVACSNGANGLASKWPTLGKFPKFPNLGGVPGVVWNSPLCGTCWKLDLVDSKGLLHSTTITAIDAAGTFNIGKKAFGAWAGDSGIAAGFAMAAATQVPPSQCGF